MNLCRGLLAVILLLPGSLRAEEEIPVTAKARTDLTVTIYNEDLALIKDSRQLSLKKGVSSLALEDISARIRPETVIVRGSGVSVREQDFNFDLLTPNTLLEKSVGETVRLIRLNRETGEEEVKTAEVLSVENGTVLKVGDRIETAPPGRVVFSEIPEKLRVRPTLVLDLESRKGGERPVDVSYLTRGLEWKADYVAELSSDRKTMALNGWVTLTNKSGVAYPEARVQLVAGDVNQVRSRMVHRRKNMLSAARAPSQSMKQESFMDYHLYTLERRTEIADKQTKQVALLSAAEIPVERTYRFKNPVRVRRGSGGTLSKRKASVFFEFDNTKKKNLGTPLPAGVVRVYGGDESGRLLFAGEDRIGHTARGEDIRLSLGSAFDVSAKPKQVDFTALGKTVYENAYQITLKNGGKKDVEVIVDQHFPHEWEILSASHSHEEPDSGRARWRVSIPAGGETDLSFRVRIRQR